MTSTKIIIVDDHQLIIDGLTSLLKTSSFEVTATFNDGETALAYIDQHASTIQIVISDISMPLMSGIELCKKVKENHGSIFVLILSMFSSAAAINEALMAEADGFIIKNATKTNFLEALHKIANGGTYFSEEILPHLYRGIKQNIAKETAKNILSERELEILTLITQELTSDEIAGKLFISKKTVDNHRTNMLIKTNSKSTVGLIKYALQNNLVSF